MTALPRFLEVPGARPWELLLGAGLLLWGASELYLENWAVAEVGFLALVLHLLIFAARRFPKRRDTPPPDFIFVPFGLLHALMGGLLILYPLPGFVKLGHRMVEQGMLLAFIMGIGPYLGTRLLTGTLPAIQPPTLGRIVLNVSTGLALLLSFWIEAGYSEPLGKLLRAFTVSTHLIRTVPILRRTTRPLWHLRFLWLSFWCLLGGLWLAGLFPDYEILSLHMTFIGGFSLLTLTVATHVIAAHCGFESLWEKDTRTVLTLGISFLAALIARMISDFAADYYFGMLHIAAGIWLIGALVWGLVFIPKVAPWHISEED